MMVHRKGSRDSDIRVEILRNGGSGYRSDAATWKGRNQFLFDTNRAESLQDIHECLSQLEDAKYDTWDPDVGMGCPCCFERRIPDGLKVQAIVDQVRKYVREYALYHRIGDIEYLAEQLWDKFLLVDRVGSEKGFCSLTNSCTKHTKCREWRRDHCLACTDNQTVFAANTRQNYAQRIADDHVTRVQFSEGLSQIFGLSMSWPTLRALTDRLAQGKGNRINFATFFETLIQDRRVALDITEEIRKLGKLMVKFILKADLSPSGAFEYYDVSRYGKISLYDFRTRFKLIGFKLSVSVFDELVSRYGGRRKNRLSCRSFYRMMVDFFLVRRAELEQKHLSLSTNSFEEKRLRAYLEQMDRFVFDIFQNH
mmetsp:Transcript_16936/g.27423  ORF Transcript_16936/g.27423 Transcript_16936/m.27423 type:complete len:367 (-) Transcript_16936:172-1272(-)